MQPLQRRAIERRQPLARDGEHLVQCVAAPFPDRDVDRDGFDQSGLREGFEHRPRGGQPLIDVGQGGGDALQVGGGTPMAAKHSLAFAGLKAGMVQIDIDLDQGVARIG